MRTKNNPEKFAGFKGCQREISLNHYQALLAECHTNLTMHSRITISDYNV